MTDENFHFSPTLESFSTSEFFCSSCASSLIIGNWIWTASLKLPLIGIEDGEEEEASGSDSGSAQEEDEEDRETSQREEKDVPVAMWVSILQSTETYSPITFQLNLCY